MKLTAVTFDVGGTLIEPWPSVGHVYAEVAARHGAGNFPPELLNARFKAAWPPGTSFSFTRAAWAELVNQTFRGLCARPPSATFFPELYEHFAQASPWRIFEDVLPTLDALASRGLRLGVISNWDERLRLLLHRLGLNKYFEVVVVSCEAGCTKPAPAIFESAARNFGLPAAAMLHVGDDRELDFLGAERAGFGALQLVRGGAGAGAAAVRSLAEIPATLDKRA